VSQAPQQKGWIFDLDGTLVDSLPGIAGSLNRALLACGRNTYSLAEVRRFIGDGIVMLVQRATPDASEQERDQMLQLFRDDYSKHWSDGTDVYDGIRELLTILQKQHLRLAVLSNKPHAFTVEIVEYLFPGIFDPIIGQRHGIPHKPDPAGLQEILDQWQLPAASCALLGDSTMDLQTAHALGVQTAAATWGYHDRDTLLALAPDHLFASPREMIDAIHRSSGVTAP
jgi:phosphoglycolate phosphatase